MCQFLASVFICSISWINSVYKKCTCSKWNFPYILPNTNEFRRKKNRTKKTWTRQNLIVTLIWCNNFFSLARQRWGKKSKKTICCWLLYDRDEGLVKAMSPAVCKHSSDFSSAVCFKQCWTHCVITAFAFLRHAIRFSQIWGFYVLKKKTRFENKYIQKKTF